MDIIPEVYLQTVYKSIVSKLITKLDDQHYLGDINLQQDQIQDIQDLWNKKISQHQKKDIYVNQIKDINYLQKDLQSYNNEKEEKQNEIKFQQQKKQLQLKKIQQNNKNKKDQKRNEKNTKKIEEIYKDYQQDKQHKNEKIFLEDDDNSDSQTSYSSSYNGFFKSNCNKIQNKKVKKEEPIISQNNIKQEQQVIDPNDDFINIFKLYEQDQKNTTNNNESSIKREFDSDSDQNNKQTKFQKKQLNSSEENDSGSGIDLDSEDEHDIDQFLVQQKDFENIDNVILGRYSDIIQSHNRKSGDRKYHMRLYNTWCRIDKKEFFVGKLDLNLEENNPNQTQINNCSNNLKLQQYKNISQQQQQDYPLLNNIIKDIGKKKKFLYETNDDTSQSSQQNLEMHMKMVKNNLNTHIFNSNNININESNKYVCQICEKQFRILKQLQQHQRLQHFTLAYGVNNYVFKQVPLQKQSQIKQQQQLKDIQNNNNNIQNRNGI